MKEGEYRAEAKRFFVDKLDKDGNVIETQVITHRYLYVTWGKEDYRVYIFTRKDPDTEEVRTSYTISEKKRPASTYCQILTDKERRKQETSLKKHPWVKRETVNKDRLFLLLRIWLGDKAQIAYEAMLAAEVPKKERKKKDEKEAKTKTK